MTLPKNQFNIPHLSYKRNRGLLNSEEKLALEKWYDSHSDDSLIIEAEESEMIEKRLSRILVGSQERINAAKPKVHRLGQTWVRWAASILLFSGIAISAYLLMNKRPKVLDISETKNILSGKKHASLTLSDGKVIDLSGARNATITGSDGVVISKELSGKLVYKLSGNDQLAISAENAYNTLRTPKGGEYDIVLSDGSIVSLNAGSALRFPQHFSGDRREVFLEGEAYFQVAHDSKHPFQVHNGKQIVEVLGTQFNVNSYEDEPDGQVTTLVKGSVKVKSVEKTLLLKPGQQSKLTSDGKMEISQADLSTVLAWKNGLTLFKDAPLSSIMRQVARWYDIAYKIKSVETQKKFNGGFRRNAPLSSVVQILSESGIKVTLQEIDGTRTLVLEP